MRMLIIGGWRVVLARAQADWLIVSAAFLITLLATSLLAAAPIYATATTQAGLRRSLIDAPPAQSDLALSADVSGADYARIDAKVRAALAPILALAGGSGVRTGVSESYALPNQQTVSKLAVFAFFERLPEHARLVAGAWPQTTAAPYAVALPQPAAKALGLKLGQQITLTDRLDAQRRLPIRISGIYQISDPHDPYWFGDALATTSVQSGASFTTYGPLVVTPGVFFGAVTAVPARVQWRLFPDFAQLAIGNAPALRDAVTALKTQFSGGGASSSVMTNLDQLIQAAERALLVTQSTVLVLMLQLVLLACYALALTAGLLADQRRSERSLLTARGASQRQLIAFTLVEALLLAVPAVIAGPWLAAAALRIFNHAGPLAAVELALSPQVSGLAFALSAAGGLACVIVLVWPALFSKRPRSQRQGAVGFAQAARLDLALLVLAGLGFWQLKRYGAPLTQSAEGTLGIDPLLIAAPALALLAGAVLALRLIPLLARLADRMAAHSRRLVLPLGAWQVSRRPSRYARSGLLLMLALGIGLFSLAYARTWTQAQQDQAAYQAGADLRLTPTPGSSSLPPIDRAGAYRTVSGVQQSLPVARLIAPLPQSDQVAHLLLLDSAHAAGVVAFRQDLAHIPFTDLMAKLTQGRPKLAAVPLPGRPERIALDAQAGTQGAPLSLDLSAVLRDANGVLHQVALGSLPADGLRHTLSAALTARLTDGRLAEATAPLELVQIECSAPPQSGVSRTVQLALTQLAVSAASSGSAWQAVPFIPSAIGGKPAAKGFVIATQAADLRALSDAPQADLNAASPSGISLTLATGAVPRGSRDAPPTTFALRPAGTVLPATIPVLVSDRLLLLASTRVGDSFPLQFGGQQVTAVIAGAVRGFPTIDPHQDQAIVADLATISAFQLIRGAVLTLPSEYWLELAPGAASSVAATLRQAPYSNGGVVSRAELAQQGLSDPVSLGTLGALILGFVAASLVACLGFAVSAVISVRERLSEFATLRALGLSGPQLAGWLAVEQGALLLLGFAGGAVLGLGLAWLILPLLGLTQSGTQAFPKLIVVVPWGELAVLMLAVVALLVVAVAVLGGILRRLGVAAVLRAGAE